MTGCGGFGADPGGGADPAGAPSAVAMVVGGPITPADVAGLCARVRALLRNHDAELLLCDVGALTEPDVGTVEALVRLQLTALRLGGRLRLCRVPGELRDLLEITGFSDVVPRVGSATLAGTGRLEPDEYGG